MKRWRDGVVYKENNTVRKYRRFKFLELSEESLRATWKTSFFSLDGIHFKIFFIIVIYYYLFIILLFACRVIFFFFLFRVYKLYVCTKLKGSRKQDESNQKCYSLRSRQRVIKFVHSKVERFFTSILCTKPTTFCFNVHKFTDIYTRTIFLILLVLNFTNKI